MLANYRLIMIGLVVLWLLFFAALLVLEPFRDWLVHLAISAITAALVWGYYKSENKNRS